MLSLIATLSLLISTVAGQGSEHYQKWLAEDVKYIISDHEKKEFERLSTVAEQELFVEDFWKKRDPDLSTELNEFQQEHYRRIDYANQRFNNEGRPGWKTPRGQTYILHGAPDDIRYSFGHQQRIQVFRPTSILNPGGSPVPVAEVEVLSPESETWTYYHLEGAQSYRSYFSIIFAKMDPAQLFSFEQTVKKIQPNAPVELRAIRDQLIKAFTSQKTYLRNDFRVAYAGPPRFRDAEDLISNAFLPYTQPIDRFSLQEAEADLFRSTGEHLERQLARRARLKQLVEGRIFLSELPLEVGVGFTRWFKGYVSIPFHLKIHLSDHPPRRLELYADLIDNSTGRVAAIVDDLLQPSSKSNSNQELSYQSRLTARPGDYRLRVIASDPAGQRIGLWEKSITVPDLTGNGFGVSQLILCEEVLDRREPDEAQKEASTLRLGQSALNYDDYTFVPAVDRPFRRGENLTTLLEVYHPTLRAGEPDVEVRTVGKPEGGSPFTLAAQHLDYLSGDTADTIVYAFTIALKSLDPGNYELIVTVTDLPTGKVLERQTRLRIQ